ncbi:hypothetical protein J3R30DRAFT_3406742 [Lentinula aciculospora]|uniref:Uncharacterized protein n=1 Tax=Lentinula aciculospora TaxID=153920 RepID=A0A9W9A2Z4_9AGAR|nr:hypothetical protein J3R30DRAFT_3406742 [Lentinula aciculospora]
MSARPEPAATDPFIKLEEIEESLAFEYSPHEKPKRRNRYPSITAPTGLDQADADEALCRSCFSSFPLRDGISSRHPSPAYSFNFRDPEGVDSAITSLNFAYNTGATMDIPWQEVLATERLSRLARHNTARNSRRCGSWRSDYKCHAVEVVKDSERMLDEDAGLNADDPLSGGQFSSSNLKRREVTTMACNISKGPLERLE